MNVTLTPPSPSVISNAKRKLKSLTERILLINAELIYETPNENSELIPLVSGIDFKVLGSSNNIYSIQIWKSWTNYGRISCTCTCPDFSIRGNTCKHIYWLGSKKFYSMNPEDWDIFDYNSIVTEYWILENNDNNIGRNSDCPICLENIDYNNETTICCKTQCRNSVHAICWGRYYDISNNATCVFCRSETMPFM